MAADKLTDEQMDELDLSEEEREALADDEGGEGGDAGAGDDGAGGNADDAGGDDGEGDGAGSDDGGQGDGDDNDKDGEGSGDQDGAGDEGADDGGTGDGGKVETPEAAGGAPPITADMMGVDVAAAKERLTAIEGEITALTSTRDAALKELKGQYEEGDIDAEEYAEKRDEIVSKANDDKITLIEERAGLKSDIRVAEGVSKASFAQRWNADRDAFLGANEAIQKDDILYEAFSREVEKINSTPEGQKLNNTQLLEAAKKKIAHLLPKEEAGETEEQKKARLVREAREAQAKKDREKAAKTKTLREAPSADHDTDESEFAYLDALEGEDLEEALAKLPPDKVEKYLALQ